MVSEKYVMGIDFSKQPDNEIWYIKPNNKLVDNNNNNNVLGGYGKQSGLKLISNSYEDGIGKLKYNIPVITLGEDMLRYETDALVISVPRRVKAIAAFTLGYGDGRRLDPIKNIIFLNPNEINYNSQFYPCTENLIVMAGCTKYYKEFNCNIIEKDLKDNEEIIFSNQDVKRICINSWEPSKNNKFYRWEAEFVSNIGEAFSNIGSLTNLRDFNYFINVKTLNGAFRSCINLEEAIFWEGLTYFKDDVMGGCTKLKLADFPTTIKDLGQMWVRQKLADPAIVICRSSTPPKISDYNIQSVAKYLYVPDESLDLYKSDEIIKKYISTNILPISQYKG